MPLDPSIVDQLGLDLGAGIGTIMRRYYPLLLGDAYRDASALLQLQLDLDLENEFVQSVLAELAKDVKSVAETTKQEIRDLVGQAASEGWSNEDLARQIRERGDIASRSRSLLIAQTESASAYNRGSVMAYRESGVVAGKEWLTADEACDICEPLDGKIVDLDKSWPGGIEHPPAHPGCRCAIAPILS